MSTLLAALDGKHSPESLVEVSGLKMDAVSRIVSALRDVGAVHNATDLWRWWVATSANPPPFLPGMSPEHAYALPVWSLRGCGQGVHDPSVWSRGPDETITVQRHSLDLASAQVGNKSRLAFRVARLAAQVMHPFADGHLAFSSAGAMWPIHLWIVTQQSGTAANVTWVDHWAQRLVTFRSVDPEQLASCFVADASLMQALEAGAALVVLTAQTDRICGKYGNRGWTYILLEAGQVIGNLERSASSFSVATRTIGGFFDDRVQNLLLPKDLLPIACIIVADKP